MSYYQSQGDYYGGQGDPFLGFLPGLVRAGIGLAAKFRKARPALSAIVQHPVVRSAGSAALAAGATAGAEALMRRPVGIPSALAMRGTLGPMLGPVGVKGFHMSKPRRCGGVIIPSHPVRNRRMRVTNPRALRRAIRRATGFAHLARKVLRFTSPRAPKGRAVFKRRARKK